MKFSGGIIKLIMVVAAMGMFAKASSQSLSVTNSDPMLTQYWAVPTLLNPAATGGTDYLRIRGAGRLDYLGSKDSPKNFMATGDSPFKLLGKKIGAGVLVYSESYDLFRNLMIGAQGSYKLNIKKSHLSIGLQIGYYQSKFKGSELVLNMGGSTGGGGTDIPADPENPASPGEGGDTDNGDDGATDEPDDDGYNDIPTQDVSGGTIDISLGIRYEHPKFYAGISVLHLTNPALKLKREEETEANLNYVESKLPMTMYFEGGGNIAINNSLFTLQPSLLIGTDFSDFRGLVEMRATYNRKVTFGVDYRYNRAVGIVAGLMLKDFYVGYNWEYDYSGHPRGSTGNHEIVLGYQLKIDKGGKNTFSHRSIRIM